MTAALPRATPQAHPRLTANDAAISIASALQELPFRRDTIDEDELRLLRMARAWGWSWSDIAAAYPPSPRTAAPWSAEGVRRRYLILDAKRQASSPQEAA